MIRQDVQKRKCIAALLLAMVLFALQQSCAQTYGLDKGQALSGELKEFQVALDALGNKGTNTIKFRATYVAGEHSGAVINIDQTIDAMGIVKEKRSSVYSDASAPSRPSRVSSPHFQTSRHPDNGSIFNPAATITRILGMNDVSAERTTVTDPVTGSPREGILLTSSANATHFLPRQVWFFSNATKLPEEVIVYAMNPRGSQPLVDTVTVYKDFTDVKGMKFPHIINQTVRTGQTLTITIDEISEGATN